MASSNIRLLSPRQISKNPENPRLIFREDELLSLEHSIAQQGILVPLSVYSDAKRHILLDGERRWRCAVKLGLDRIPVIIQPKPDRMQNIMMMFAIHNARRDWDPLPTAYKLEQLEKEYTRRQKRPPTEEELAQLASISRGEVRRLRNLLALPVHYRAELMSELEKPRSQQVLTVDHVLETTKGAQALRRRDIIDDREEDRLRRALLNKFRSKVEKNTVAPRQLARIARAVERDELTAGRARRVVLRLIDEPNFSVADAFRASVEQIDFEHSSEQLVDRLAARLEEHLSRGYEIGDGLSARLRHLRSLIRDLLS